MVSGNDKYWFENDDKEKSEVGQGESGIAEENEKEDLFGFDASDTLDSSVTSAPSEKITSPLDSANVPPSDKPDFSAPENSQDFFDSHENHYRSDYARSGIDEADLNGDGKIKAVRGHMLKKLLKYDFRALFKFLVPCYIVLGALAVLCAICLPIAEHMSASDVETGVVVPFMMAMSSIIILYIVGVALCSAICIFNIAVHFLKNLFGAEGYLTLSIPATSEEHIFSKLISGFVTIFLTILVAIASILIVAVPYWREVFPALENFFVSLGEIYHEFPADMAMLTIEIVFLLLIGIIFNLQIVYACVCVGQMIVNKSRAGAAAIAYVIYLAVSQVIYIFFMSTGFLGGIIDSAVAVHLFLWILIALAAGGSVGLFFFEKYVLKNRVNLG